MSDQQLPPGMRAAAAAADQIGERIRADAQWHWDAGFTHYYLSLDSDQATTRYIQWVENVGWRLEHAGWVWAQKGWVGFGGFTLLNSGIVGNYLFGRTRSSLPDMAAPPNPVADTI